MTFKLRLHKSQYHQEIEYFRLEASRNINNSKNSKVSVLYNEMKSMGKQKERQDREIGNGEY